MADSSRPGAVLFDMDGVLVDSEPLWRRAEIEGFAEVGLVLTETDCLRTQGLRIDEAVDYWFTRRPWTGRSPHDVARDIEERVGALVRAEATPLAGVERSIEAALSRDWRLGLASSSSIRLIRTVLDHLGIREAFEAIHSAEVEAFGKPHPAVYLSTAAALDVAPSRCVAIEDSVNGVVSALAARMRCIAIPGPEALSDPRFAIATRRLASLDSLGEALDDLEREGEPGDAAR